MAVSAIGTNWVRLFTTSPFPVVLPKCDQGRLELSRSILRMFLVAPARRMSDVVKTPGTLRDERNSNVEREFDEIARDFLYKASMIRVRELSTIFSIQGCLSTRYLTIFGLEAFVRRGRILPRDIILV
jgi:hypothetical protein